MSKTSFAFVMILVSACGDSGAAPKLESNSPAHGGDAASEHGDASSEPVQNPDANSPAEELDAGADAASSEPSQQDADVAMDASDLDAATPHEDAGNHDAAVHEHDAGHVLTADEMLAAAVEQKVRTCKVVGQGTFNAGAVQDSFDRCIANCYVSAPCSAVYGAACNGDHNSFYNCQTSCYAYDSASMQYAFPIPADGYLCKDGARIPHVAVCDDGFVGNCKAGEDEQGCAKFTCKDGDKISSKYVCDGVSMKGAKASLGGCKDGSDETGCAPMCVGP